MVLAPTSSISPAFGVLSSKTDLFKGENPGVLGGKC